MPAGMNTEPVPDRGPAAKVSHTEISSPWPHGALWALGAEPAWHVTWKRAMLLSSNLSSSQNRSGPRRPPHRAAAPIPSAPAGFQPAPHVAGHVACGCRRLGAQGSSWGQRGDGLMRGPGRFAQESPRPCLNLELLLLGESPALPWAPCRARWSLLSRGPACWVWGSRAQPTMGYVLGCSGWLEIDRLATASP